MRTVVAKMLSSPVNAKDGEGSWLVWCGTPPAPIEAAVVPNGDSDDGRWIWAAFAPRLGRRMSGSASTYADALYDVVDQVARWEAGGMPQVAIAADPRLKVPKAKVIDPGVDQDAPLPATEVAAGSRDRGSTPRAPTKPAARRAAAKKKQTPTEGK